MQHESRLAKLEASGGVKLTPEEAWDEAVSRCEDGTATFTQMSMVVTEHAEAYCKLVLPVVPMLVAMRDAGAFMYGPLPALAYAPGEALSSGVIEHLEDFKYLIDLSPEDYAEWNRRSRTAFLSITPQDRYTAAAWAIILGLPDASKARAQAWTCSVDGTWRLSDQVLAAADNAGLVVPSLLPRDPAQMVDAYLKAADLHAKGQGPKPVGWP